MAAQRAKTRDYIVRVCYEIVKRCSHYRLVRCKYGATDWDHFIFTTLHTGLTRLKLLGHDLEMNEQPKFDSIRMLDSIIKDIANILHAFK